MKIRRAYKYRIYPNKQQQQELAVQFGHVRLIFNYGLDARKEAFKETDKGLSYTATALLLPKFKQDLPWLKEANSQVLQQKLKDLDTAYVNFFQGRAGYPTFKNKNSHQAIRHPQRFKLTDSQIYLPKVGWVTLVLHEKIANQRSDFIHKLSNRLVRSHGTVSLENLNVPGMVKCHSLGGRLTSVKQEAQCL